MIKDTMIQLNKKSIILFGIMILTILMSISNINAIGDMETIPTIEPVVQGHEVPLPQGGTNGTAPWDYCNISTVVDPNHNILVHDVMMTALGTSFTYLLRAPNTTQLGTYTVTGYCGDNINKQAFAYTFEVTTTGQDNSITLWATLSLLACAIIVLIMAFAFDSIYLAFMSGVLWLVEGVLITIYGFGNSMNTYTTAISIVSLAIGLIIIFAAAFHHDDGEGLAKAFGLDSKEEVDEHDYFASKD